MARHGLRCARPGTFGGVRFGVAVPQAFAFVEPAAQQRLATSIEDLGFDSLWVSDHIVVPEGERYIPENMLEPLALLAWLAARTHTITLGTSVLVVPYRDPVFLAKHLATIDVLAAGASSSASVSAGSG